MHDAITDILGRGLMRVRPAPLAVSLKKLLGIKRRVIDTPEGKFWVDPANLIGRQLIDTGLFETTMIATLKASLSPGGTFVDLGANEGYFTVIGARLVGPTGRVLAIEPQERLHPVIAKNLEVNGLANVVIEAAAISDRVGTAKFHLAADTNSGGSGFTNMARYSLETREVPMKTLAQVFSERGIGRVDLMKVDIEGAEYEAILGSKELFESDRIKSIALELHPQQMAARNRAAADIERFLFEAGYAQEASVWRKT